MRPVSPGPCCWRIAHSEVSLGWGGQEHRIIAELRGFQGRGCHVWLLAPPDSQILQRASVERIATVPLYADRLSFTLSVIRIARWLRQNRIQILNTHSSRDGWLAGIAGRLARVPFVVRTRHFDVPVAHRWVSGFVYRRLADHVLTTSPKVTAHFRELFQLPESRVSTLPTGVDVKLFSPRGEVAGFTPAAREKNLPLIGMVSIVRLAKGHETLLRAAQLLRVQGFEARYLIVGEGPYLEAVRQKAKELELTHCVTFAPHREDVPAVLRALNVLVIPSLHEGIPQIGLQALACQTPVVGSDVGGIPEIIRNGETGRIFPVNDAAQLAAKIQETLRQPEQTRRMAERGRALVEREHSLDAMLNKLDAIYRKHLPSA